MDGDEDEDDTDDLENEFNYAQGTSNARRQWQGDDPDLSSSSRRESGQPIPLLTNGHSVGNYRNEILNNTYISKIKMFFLN